MDFFKDLNDIRNSFRRFAGLLPKNGLLILNREIERYEEIAQDLPCPVATFGMDSESDYQACEISYDTFARASFQLVKNSIPILPFRLAVPGAHNVSNALSAIAAADSLHIPMETIQRGLLSFTGTDRRFQYKGEINGFTIIDDYAHHPTEIRATLKAAAHYPHREIWCVFQPHTYTRTKAFLKEFAKALTLARLPASYLQPHQSLSIGICQCSFPGRPCCSNRHLRRPRNRYFRNQLPDPCSRAGKAWHRCSLFSFL